MMFHINLELLWKNLTYLIFRWFVLAWKCVVFLFPFFFAHIFGEINDVCNCLMDAACFSWSWLWMHVILVLMIRVFVRVGVMFNFWVFPDLRSLIILRFIYVAITTIFLIKAFSYDANNSLQKRFNILDAYITVNCNVKFNSPWIWALIITCSISLESYRFIYFCTKYFFWHFFLQKDCMCYESSKNDKQPLKMCTRTYNKVYKHENRYYTQNNYLWIKYNENGMIWCV